MKQGDKIMTTEIKAIERIRASYTEKEITKFEELKQFNSKEINQLEQWSNTTFKEVIFDSNKNNWDFHNSQF